jgi:predicted amidohydrolase
MSSLRVAFVQGRPRFGRPVHNLELGLALAARVEADLVVLPELWSSGYVFSSHDEVATLAEDAKRGITARDADRGGQARATALHRRLPEVARGAITTVRCSWGPVG